MNGSLRRVCRVLPSLLPALGASALLMTALAPAPASAASLAFQASPSTDAAATPAGTGQVEGQVFLILDGESPRGLEVRIEGTDHTAMVTAAGHFVLSDVPAGEFILATGYRGTVLDRRSVQVVDGGTARVRVRPGDSASLPLDGTQATGDAPRDARPATGEAPVTVASPARDTIGAPTPPPSELERLLALLVDRGVIQQAEADAILAEARAEREAARVELAGDAIAYEPTLPLQDDAVTVQVLPFGVESWDGSSRFRIRGRAQLDGQIARWGDDIENVARQGNEFPSYGLFLRRVRLGAAGIMRQDWEWQVEADFSENEVSLANVYVAHLFPSGRLAAGYFKEVFGMEYATSSRYITFIERSAASDAYKVNREPGLLFETLRPNWYLGVGAHTGDLERDRDLRPGWAVGGRLTFAPYLEGTDFVHVGVGANHRANAYDYDDEEWARVRLRSREGVRAVDARLIGRDDLRAVENFTRTGAEFAAGFGSWWIQSEVLQVNLNLDREALEDDLGGNATDQDSLNQRGWYAQTGFFLTGESKNYRAFSGDFGPQFPNRNFSRTGDGIGAIEVAFRYSRANSLEHTRVGRGQAMDHYTLGLNWFFTPEVALKTNVMYLEGERDEFQDSAWVFGARMQFVF
ncbi:MAG: TonB-dependent receptor [Gemmatimonadales bacterium]|nr:MAG: TonB-dependent receptor [Gemmatimonadales bacterium]